MIWRLAIELQAGDRLKGGWTVDRLEYTHDPWGQCRVDVYCRKPTATSLTGAFPYSSFQVKERHDR